MKQITLIFLLILSNVTYGFMCSPGIYDLNTADSMLVMGAFESSKKRAAEMAREVDGINPISTIYTSEEVGRRWNSDSPMLKITFNSQYLLAKECVAEVDRSEKSIEKFLSLSTKRYRSWNKFVTDCVSRGEDKLAERGENYKKHHKDASLTVMMFRDETLNSLARECRKRLQFFEEALSARDSQRNCD